MTAYPRQSNPEWSSLLAYQAQGRISHVDSRYDERGWLCECNVGIIQKRTFGKTRERAASALLWLVRDALEAK